MVRKEVAHKNLEICVIRVMSRWLVKKISAHGRAIFIHFLNYLSIYSSKLFTREGNSRYCMSKAKSKYIIPDSLEVDLV